MLVCSLADERNVCCTNSLTASPAECGGKGRHRGHTYTRACLRVQASWGTDTNTPRVGTLACSAAVLRQGLGGGNRREAAHELFGSTQYASVAWLFCFTYWGGIPAAIAYARGRPGWCAHAPGASRCARNCRPESSMSCRPRLNAMPRST